MTAWNRVLRAIFPPREVCVLCGRPGEPLCYECRSRIRKHIYKAHCPLCGRDNLSGNICASCSEGVYSAKQGACAYDYEQAQKAIIAYKYENYEELNVYFSEDMVNAARVLPLERIQAVAPVPIHPFRYLSRGYNQSALLAREVAKTLGQPFLPDMLRRTVYKASLSMQPERERQKRVEWVKGMYAPGRGFQPVSGVLLVDDVLTSGATLSECTRVLIRAGVKEVYTLTAAAVREES